MITILVILAIVFLLTYDPNSRTLEQFIDPQKCCADNTYMAHNPTQCESPHFISRQFGEPASCPPKYSHAYLGVLT